MKCLGIFHPFKNHLSEKWQGMEREAKVGSFFFVKSWYLSTWYLGPGVRTVGNLQSFWELWLMGCEKETEWGWLELTEKDRSWWQRLRVASAPRVSTRMFQGCGRSRKQEHGEGRWDFGCPTVEHPEVLILLLLTEGVGWMARHFLRWMDGSEVWRVLCSGRACAEDPWDSTSTNACCENILYLMKYGSSYTKILPGDLRGGGT